MAKWTDTYEAGSVMDQADPETRAMLKRRLRELRLDTGLMEKWARNGFTSGRELAEHQDEISSRLYEV